MANKRGNISTSDNSSSASVALTGSKPPVEQAHHDGKTEVHCISPNSYLYWGHFVGDYHLSQHSMVLGTENNYSCCIGWIQTTSGTGSLWVVEIVKQKFIVSDPTFPLLRMFGDYHLSHQSIVLGHKNNYCIKHSTCCIGRVQTTSGTGSLWLVVIVKQKFIASDPTFPLLRMFGDYHLSQPSIVRLGTENNNRIKKPLLHWLDPNYQLVHQDWQWYCKQKFDVSDPIVTFTEDTLMETNIFLNTQWF